MKGRDDGDENFPNSCVLFFPLRCHDLQRTVTRCRWRERILQMDLAAATTAEERAVLTARLEEVEAMLIWIAANVTR